MNDFSKICILIPSFNPDENLNGLLSEIVKSNWKKIIIVDDGSISETKKTFDTIVKKYGVTLLTHEINKGKGAAIKTGLDYIKKNDFDSDGLITVDADGQHLVKDIIRVAESAVKNFNDVVFGVRVFDKNTPFASLFGNKVTRFLLHSINNIAISDTQTGLRYLPRILIDDLLKLPSNRYDYELDCLINIKNLGMNIIQVKIETVYINNNKGSHFKGLLDSSKVLLILFRHSIISLSCFGFDIFLFALFFSYSESVLFATFIARLIVLPVYFIANKLIAFRSFSRIKIFQEIVVYLCLVALIAFLSATLVKLSEGYALHTILMLKVVVDTSLFFFAFYVQKNIIFKKTTQ